MANSISMARADIIRPYIAALAMALTFSCSSDIELPPPPSTLSSSSLPSGKVLCLYSGGCTTLASEDCSIIGGQVVESCSAVSSSSIALSSSSSLPANTVLCLYNGSCNAVSNETCSVIGGQAVQSCPAVSSSSSIALSSSSATPITPSSSGIARSSSSLSGTSGTFTDSRDGQSYKWVKIGSQVWLAENLNYYVSVIQCDIYDAPDCTKTVSKFYSIGFLYDWTTAMALPARCDVASCSSRINTPHQGICPSGWHLPSDEEWQILVDLAGGDEVAGNILKATSGWNWYDFYDRSGNGTDDYGFAALPGGRIISSGGSFIDAGNQGFWWSTKEYGSSDAYLRDIYYGHGSVGRYSTNKSGLYSVRCLKD